MSVVPAEKATAVSDRTNEDMCEFSRSPWSPLHACIVGASHLATRSAGYWEAKIGERSQSLLEVNTGGANDLFQRAKYLQVCGEWKDMSPEVAQNAEIGRSERKWLGQVGHRSPMGICKG